MDVLENQLQCLQLLFYGQEVLLPEQQAFW
jgi:hypothetical protein